MNNERINIVIRIKKTKKPEKITFTSPGKKETKKKLKHVSK